MDSINYFLKELPFKAEYKGLEFYPVIFSHNGEIKVTYKLSSKHLNAENKNSWNNPFIETGKVIPSDYLVMRDKIKSDNDLGMALQYVKFWFDGQTNVKIYNHKQSDKQEEIKIKQAPASTSNTQNKEAQKTETEVQRNHRIAMENAAAELAAEGLSVTPEPPPPPQQEITPQFIAQMKAKGVYEGYINICKTNRIPVLPEDTNQTLRAKIESAPKTPVPGVTPGANQTSNIPQQNVNVNQPASPPPFMPTATPNADNSTIWHPTQGEAATPGNYTSEQIQQAMDFYCARSTEKTATQAIENMKNMCGDNFEILRDGNQTTSIAFQLKDGTRVPKKFFFKIKQG